MLAVVLIAALVAVVLTLASHGPDDGFLLALSTRSLFILWLAMTSAAVLCRCRHWLTALGRRRGLIVGFVLLQLVTLAVSEAGWWLNSAYGDYRLIALEHGAFLFRNFAISVIVSGMVLRYFYVAGEWRRNVELESRAASGRSRPAYDRISCSTA